MPRIELPPTTPYQLVVFGPTISVRVGFDPGYAPERGVLPVLPPNEYPAIIDTGATQSCIDVSLALALGLNVVDNIPVSGVSGQTMVNTYSAQIVIPSMNRVIHGRFAGAYLQEGGHRHLAIIGRTFLRHHRLVYDGRSGEVTLESD